MRHPHGQGAGGSFSLGWGGLDAETIYSLGGEGDRTINGGLTLTDRT
jgi:hypothetical protein